VSVCLFLILDGSDFLVTDGSGNHGACFSLDKLIASESIDAFFRCFLVTSCMPIELFSSFGDGLNELDIFMFF